MAFKINPFVAIAAGVSAIFIARSLQSTEKGGTTPPPMPAPSPAKIMTEADILKYLTETAALIAPQNYNPPGSPTVAQEYLDLKQNFPEKCVALAGLLAAPDQRAAFDMSSPFVIDLTKFFQMARRPGQSIADWPRFMKLRDVFSFRVGQMNQH